MSRRLQRAAGRFRSVSEAYAWLDGHINYELELDHIHYSDRTFELDEFRGLLDRLGNPQRAAHTIHIAGTRGKGSSALFLEAVLRGLGMKVATYTSPHFVEYRERIRVDGRPIEGDTFSRALEEVSSRTEPTAEQPRGFKTVFEFLTAMFFQVAREQEVDWMVVETGLGGRLDATNALDAGPVLLTRIGLEHTDLLGTTHRAIAREKAAILKSGGWGLVSEQDANGEALRVFRERSAETGAPIAPASEICPLREESYHSEGMSLRYDFRGEPLRLELPLIGPFLTENLQGALAMAAGLVDRGLIPELHSDRLSELLAGVRLQGRMEPVSGFPFLYADSGHCPTAAVALAETMGAHFGSRSAIAVVGMAKDKNAEGFFEAMATWPGWKRLLCYSLDHPRGQSAEILAKAAKPFFPNVEVADKLSEALQAATAGGANSDSIIATGSAYGVESVRAWGDNMAETIPKPVRRLTREQVIDILERNARLYKNEDTLATYIAQLAMYLIEYEYDWSESAASPPEPLRAKRDADTKFKKRNQPVDPSFIPSLHAIASITPKPGDPPSRACPHCGTLIHDVLICPSCRNLTR